MTSFGCQQKHAKLVSHNNLVGVTEWCEQSILKELPQVQPLAVPFRHSTQVFRFCWTSGEFLSMPVELDRQLLHDRQYKSGKAGHGKPPGVIVDGHV
jgi:hypothetical protein